MAGNSAGIHPGNASQRNLRRLLLKRIMKCWIFGPPAFVVTRRLAAPGFAALAIADEALRVREPTAASFVSMPLSCNNSATMSIPVADVTSSHSAGLATATEWMAGWPANVGIAPPAVCEPNQFSQATRSCYDV